MAICNACANVGISTLVIPLVDNGQLDTPEQENILIDYLLSQIDFLAGLSIKVVFESDYSPSELGRFISRLPVDLFGVNYDIGNSASLGYDPLEEFDSYGHRILNVHVKDRLINGPTVPLLSGNADFHLVFSKLFDSGYQGNLILQTARSLNGNHVQLVQDYRDLVLKIIQEVIASS